MSCMMYYFGGDLLIPDSQRVHCKQRRSGRGAAVCSNSSWSPDGATFYCINKSLLHYWWVNHFSNSYKITACSVNTSTVAGCFASFNKSENEIKIRREHKERPQGVVADRSVLDGVERNPPRQRKKTNSFFLLPPGEGRGVGLAPHQSFM